MFLQLPTTNPKDTWVFYVLTADAGVFHADIVRFSELTMLDGTPDLNGRGQINLCVIDTAEDLQVLYNRANAYLAGKEWRGQWQHVLRDKLVKLTSKAHGNAKMVICETTGEQFDSAWSCAREHNLSYAQLTNHLNRLPSYKSVKKKTYRWA